MELKFAPKPDPELRLNSFTYASETHLILRYDTVEDRRFASGSETVRYDRAVSLRMGDWNIAVLLANRSGFFSATGISALTPDDSETVLMQMALISGVDDRGGGSRMSEDARFSNILYEVDLNTGRGTRIDSGLFYGNLFAPDGEPLLRIDLDPETDRYEVRREGSGRTLLYRGVHPALPPAVTGLYDASSVVMIIQDGPERGMWRMDMQSGERSPLPGVEEGQIYGPWHDPVTDHLLALGGDENGRPIQRLMDPGLKELANSIKDALGASQALLSGFSWDFRFMVFRVTEAGRSPRYFLLDRADNSLKAVGATYPALEGKDLAQVSMIAYEASDGMEIPAVLSLPATYDETDPPPLIVLPHGGPQAHDTLAFDWWSQAYAAMGYAVLQPNFRGSSGYGQDFIEAGYGEFGGRMIEDMLDGARHLRAEGIVADRPYCFAGASYGGYATLMAAILGQSEVACAISVAGVTDPRLQVGRRTNDANASAMEFWSRYMGADAMAGGAAAVEISPAERADEIRSPLMIIHGTEDTVVPFEQAQEIMRKLPNPSSARFVPLEQETHFLTREDSRLTLLEESAAFLDQHLPLD